MHPRHLRAVAALLFAVTAFADDPGPRDCFQVFDPANLNVGDSVFNITNTGTENTAAGAPDNICANVYAFSPDEQLISCCSCPVTPNGLVSFSSQDLLNNALTLSRPTSIVVKLLATKGIACNAANAPDASLATGMKAWGTKLHPLPTTPVAFAITETKFASATLDDGELFRITTLCSFIQANGSGFGICKPCRVGGQ